MGMILIRVSLSILGDRPLRALAGLGLPLLLGCSSAVAMAREPAPLVQVHSQSQLPVGLDNPDRGVFWLSLGGVSLAALLLGWFGPGQRRARKLNLRSQIPGLLGGDEQFLATILDAIPTALFGKDPKDRFRYRLWNARAEEVFGLKREEVLGKTDEELFSPAEAARFRLEDLKVLTRSQTVEASEEQVFSRSRGLIFLHTLKAPVLDSAGQPCLILAISQDITAQKHLELELKKSRSSLAKAQALAGIGNWQWEVGSNEVTWSDQMFCLLGHAPGEVAPGFHPVLERTHPEDRGILRRSLRRFHNAKDRPPVEFRVVPAPDKVRFVQSHIEVERDRQGNAVRLLGTFQDITERRLTEEAFRQAQKLESMGVLAGGIAHDFNNLLSAIGGNLELAQLNMGPEPPAAPFLVRIEKILRRASQLTHQMLAYSGKGRFVVKPLNLNAVAEEMPNLLEVSISKRVTLCYRFAEHLPLIDADAAQIQQVIMNLVTNASEAIGDRDGSITLRTGTEYLAAPQEQLESRGWKLLPGPYVTLEVTDTGCGMDEETQRRLFDPFFTTKFSGRGLGLSAMLGILKGHNAGIRIHSTVGQGTAFKLFFPASTAALHAEGPAGTAGAAAKPSGTILVVDDEPDVLDATCELLASLGFKVLQARDGLEAVERYTATPRDIQLVLMDLTMPRMDGREALRALRELDPQLKIVLCSGFNEADVTKDLPSPGLSGFLQKPYTFQALKDVVEHACLGFAASPGQGAGRPRGRDPRKALPRQAESSGKDSPLKPLFPSGEQGPTTC